jgi:cell wall assembly regulator SMI1
MNLDRQAAPIAATQLDSFEMTYRLTLPESYRAFLLTNNGGRPNRPVIAYRGSDGIDNETVIDRFFSLDDSRDDGQYDLAKSYIFMVSPKRLPEAVLPIARDHGGNLLCLDLRWPGAASIAFFDHEFEGTRQALVAIAASFDELLIRLQPEDDA